jgi:hypothetical protein
MVSTWKVVLASEAGVPAVFETLAVTVWTPFSARLYLQG